MLLFSDLFYNDSEDLLDIIHGVFSCGFIILPWGNFVIAVAW